MDTAAVADVYDISNLDRMGRSEVNCSSFFFLCFLAQICTDMSQFPSGWVHSADLSGTIAVFTPDESGSMEMLTQRKIINMHQVLDKYSCYSNEKKKNLCKFHNCDSLAPWAEDLCWKHAGAGKVWLW